MFKDDKIRLIETMPEGDSILVIWVKLLTLAGEQNQRGEIIGVNELIPYTEDMLRYHLPSETFDRETGAADVLRIPNDSNP